MERIRNAVPGIKDICQLDTRWGVNATYGKHTYTGCGLKGVVAGYEKIRRLPKLQIRALHRTRTTCACAARYASSAAGYTPSSFPDGGNPCGKYVLCDGVYYQIVGVDNWKNDNGMGVSPAYALQIPNSLLREIYNLGNKTDAITFTTKDGVTVESVEKKITSIVKRAHSIHPNDKEAVEFFSLEILFRVFENLFRGINILVWMIGVGTLLSGAIGVSNIMLVAIRERTSEIGIRRAIGAKPRDILSQILSESFIITFLAGLSGIVLAVLLLAAVEPAIQEATLSDAPFQVSFGIAVRAAVVLTVLGLLAGIAPAMRALAIKPIDAMREE